MDADQFFLITLSDFLIVANDITDPDGGFGSATSQVTMLDRNGHSEELPLLSKYEVGHRILDRVAILLKP